MVRRAVLLPASVLAAGALLGAPARPGELAVSLSTLFRPYDYLDLAGEEVRFRAFTPALVLTASDLLGRDLQLALSARQVDDLAREGDADHADLLYGLLAWRSDSGRLSLTGGRQVLAQGPGFLSFDGVRAGARLGRVEIGGSVGFGFERDGRRHAFGRFAGIEARLAGSRGSLAMALSRGTDGGVEVLFKTGIDGVYRPRPGLGLRGSVVWNQAVEELDEAIGAADLALGRGRLELEAARIHPHFDPTTIWNVFNSGAYARFSARLRHPLGDAHALWTRIEARSYYDRLGGNPGLGSAEARSRAFSASVGFGSSGESGWRHAAELFLVQGYGGFRAGVAIRLGHEIGFLPGRIDLGVDLRAYDRGVRDPRQDLTTAYWAEAVLDLGRHARLRLKAEDYRNGFLLDDLRLTVKLDLHAAEAF